MTTPVTISEVLAEKVLVPNASNLVRSEKDLDGYNTRFFDLTINNIQFEFIFSTNECIAKEGFSQSKVNTIVNKLVDAHFRNISNVHQAYFKK